ncbi:hypothetical protein TorRG33x02_288970 [Trema orientale]|uniref:Uncharacterized protein n=1 Tax=Trema orientale TaxID=63057 RepID=A0A2P5CE00_TREOI|nr:hypothetical protein TorRG33x02_288970 [Trema orientale]
MFRRALETSSKPRQMSLSTIEIPSNSRDYLHRTSSWTVEDHRMPSKTIENQRPSNSVKCFRISRTIEIKSNTVGLKSNVIEIK